MDPKVFFSQTPPGRLFLAAALVASELGMEPGEGGAALAVLPLAAIVILAASMSVSLRIYAKKEF